MRELCALCLLSLMLSACGHRQPAQSTATQTAQATSAQPAPSQPVATEPGSAQPAGQPNPNVTGEPIESANQSGQPAPATPAAPAAAQPASTLEIPAGTVFRVRLEQTLDTRHNRDGDRFAATLVRGVSENGAILIPRGTQCYGHVVVSKHSGRFKGHAFLDLRLDSFRLNGRSYLIRTTDAGRRSRGHKKRNLIAIAGGAGVGTAIGAVAGGPVGAVIGAGAGGAAGTVGAAVTGRKNVRLPVETVLAFSLRRSVTVAE